MSIGSELVKDYLSRPGLAKLPSRTLAFIVYRDNKMLFKDVESVRHTIRHFRGKQGVRDRKKVSTTEFFCADGLLNPFDALPEGLKSFDDWSPFIVKGRKALIISDVHVPYHEREPLLIALKHGKDSGCDTVIINGDFGDFYSVSFWEQDPRKRNFPGEILAQKVVLETIRAIFPKAVIYFKMGNHEERFERFMKVKAPELLGVPEFEIEHLLDFLKYNIIKVPDKRIIKIGKLNIIHGHEFGKQMFSPVNPARGLYMKGKAIALCGHYHVTSNHNERTMNDEIISTWSTGCLCELRAEYAPLNKWNHGFAMISHKDGEDFQVYNYKILKGKIY